MTKLWHFRKNGNRFFIFLRYDGHKSRKGLPVLVCYLLLIFCVRLPFEEGTTRIYLYIIYINVCIYIKQSVHIMVILPLVVPLSLSVYIMPHTIPPFLPTVPMYIYSHSSFYVLLYVFVYVCINTNTYHGGRGPRTIQMYWRVLLNRFHPSRFLPAFC